MNTYDIDDENNVYSIMLVPYFDGDHLNVKVGMAFPHVDDPEDDTHVDMIATLTFMATAFKLMQSDEKFAKKILKHNKATLEEYKFAHKNAKAEPEPAKKEYLDEAKTIIKPTFGKKDK